LVVHNDLHSGPRVALWLYFGSPSGGSLELHSPAFTIGVLLDEQLS
jgi:hypothetical protein